MPRNLDLTALRSFVAVAETGGVTRAAGQLNLTQSAVSMQLKRLETAIGVALLDRTTRTVSLTPAGERLLSYARRMLDLNDQAVARLSGDEAHGELVLGVPHDIVYPAIPQVLRQFATEHPRVDVRLVASFTNTLKPLFSKGEADLILTTETGCGSDGETIAALPLIWVGAPGGTAWKQRPLRLAFEANCYFRTGVQQALDAAGIDWVMPVEAESFRSVGALVSADLAVHALLEGTDITELEPIRHGGELPKLRTMNVNLYCAPSGQTEALADLAMMLRRAYERL